MKKMHFLEYSGKDEKKKETANDDEDAKNRRQFSLMLTTMRNKDGGDDNDGICDDTEDASCTFSWSDFIGVIVLADAIVMLVPSLCRR